MGGECWGTVRSLLRPTTAAAAAVHPHPHLSSPSPSRTPRLFCVWCSITHAAFDSIVTVDPDPATDLQHIADAKEFMKK